MMEYLLIILAGGVPACVAYTGKGGHRFRTIAGTINLLLAFLVVLVAAGQLAADPPVSTAMASGFAAVVLALTAVALRISPDSPPAHGHRTPQAATQAGQQPYQAQWAAPPQHPGMAAPGQGGAPGGAAPQQPWRPSGQ
jgi:hypothetical protein